MMMLTYPESPSSLTWITEVASEMVSPMPVLLLSVLIKVVQVSDLKYLPTGSRQTSAQNPALAPYFTMTYKDLIYSSFFSVPLASLCHSTYTLAQAVSHTLEYVTFIFST